MDSTYRSEGRNDELACVVAWLRMFSGFGFDSHALPPSSRFYVGFRPPSCPSPNCLQSQRPARDCPPMRGAPSRDTNTMRYLLRIAPFQMNHVRPAHEQRPGQRQAFGLGHRYTGLLETGAKRRCCYFPRMCRGATAAH